MQKIRKILWYFPFLGFIYSAIVFIIGVFFIATVVGAPIGHGLIQFSKYLISPFTSSIVIKDNIDKKNNDLWLNFGIFVRMFWFPIGLILIVILLAQIILLFISIIEIPLAVILLKSLSTLWNPVGKNYIKP